jgi:hypothetical protein
VPSNGTQDTAKQGLSDFDFDRALFKFANERENFLDDLSFSAGTVLQSRPPMTSRAEKIKHDDEALGGRKSPFGRVGGSIRRKISFRDLNSSKKQTLNRTGELIFVIQFCSKTCFRRETLLLSALLAVHIVIPGAFTREDPGRSMRYKYFYVGL